MRNYAIEFEKRVAFIRNILADSGMNGIVYGNSGGKDSALVGILCKAACENTLGIIMPCAAKRNYEKDMDDALEVAKAYSIETRVLDLTPVRDVETANLSRITSLNEIAAANLAPRLRMLSLYAVAAAEKRLVAGTGNRSEAYVGYFTKWGDGAYDFNPIADLTVTEIYEFLDFLKAPLCVIEKAPSAALFDGQTDEMELGVTYRELDDFLMGRSISEEKKKIIASKHERSEHKRNGSIVYRQLYANGYSLKNYGKILLISFDDDEKEIIKSVLSVLNATSHNFKTEEVNYRSKIEYDGLVVALDKREVRKKEAIISLTYTEFEILQLLICNPGIVFSKEQIYNIIWKDYYGGDYGIVTTSKEGQADSLKNYQICNKDEIWKFACVMTQAVLLEENNLPNIRWHDLRSTYCTILLKNDFNPKAVSKLMGHAKEIITMDVYGDKRELIADCVDEIQPFIDEVLGLNEEKELSDDNLDIVIDTEAFL